MKADKIISMLLIACLLCFSAVAGESGAEAKAKNEIKDVTINEAYPALAMASLSFAKPGKLDKGIILKAGDLIIKQKDVDEEISKAAKEMQEELKKNQFVIVDKLTTEKLLLAEARKETAADKNSAVQKDGDIIHVYLAKLVEDVKVSDEEVAKFYEANKESCGGASLDQLKDQLKEFVRGEKQQAAVNEYVRSFGKRTAIEVSEPWLKEQSQMAADNPVDKARASGMPSVVDFGASGCRPCDMMAPILKTLEQKYAGKVNVVFVHVREQQILASRYGVTSIPVQVFFDKEGKEVFRHIGFFAQNEMENKISEMEVK